MNQSTFIAAALLGSFILYLAAKGRLQTYSAVLWGPTKAAVPGTASSGSGSSGGAGGLIAGAGGLISGASGLVSGFSGSEIGDTVLSGLSLL